MTLKVKRYSLLHEKKRVGWGEGNSLSVDYTRRPSILKVYKIKKRNAVSLLWICERVVSQNFGIPAFSLSATQACERGTTFLTKVYERTSSVEKWYIKW